MSALLTLALAAPTLAATLALAWGAAFLTWALVGPALTARSWS